MKHEVEPIMLSLIVNGRRLEIDAPDDKPPLWALREELGLLGPNDGCGVAQCGACRVLIAGRSTPSSVTLPGNAVGASVTVEGQAQADGGLSIVQQAWIEERVPQCGFCQPGFLVAVMALLDRTTQPTDAEIDQAIASICQCGSYPRIRRAIHRAPGHRG
jgi:isoquinoline 1-oxidoreductase alpha subunit